MRKSKIYPARHSQEERRDVFRMKRLNDRIEKQIPNKEVLNGQAY
jgi:hypothetical protein